jgi:NAD(P)-dependent dehydrogenase (short-subunit alcohol dehydrogenase family)
MSALGRFAGQVAIITGGNKGIGDAVTVEILLLLLM